MPGVTTKTGASYSAWWNGGLRTTAYFHNIIGILTETIGSPTPMRIPFVASRLTPQGNMLFPIEPQEWKFRQSVEYSVQANFAILDLASRYRTKFLMDIYGAGKRQIERGSTDTWTDYPKRTSAAGTLASLRSPELRNPRAYVMSSDQPDFPAAIRFANALFATGVDVQTASAAFSIAGKTYPKDSIVIGCDQAFRPHVLDMFEPQDHPHDVPAPGAAPIPPYDNAGYTLALQMGVDFDRVFETISASLVSAPAPLSIPDKPWQGFAHRFPMSSVENYRFAFQALRAGAALYVTSDKQFSTGTGDIKLRHPRVALWDRYGGSMDSGWTRWIFDQFGIDHTVVYPRMIDDGALDNSFDVLILPDGALSAELADGPAAPPANVPTEYQDMTGSLSKVSLSAMKRFVERGGVIIGIGSSAHLGTHFGLPIESALVEGGRPLPRAKFFVPGSLLAVTVDVSKPVAFGVDAEEIVMFNNNPAFKVTGGGVTSVAHFGDGDLLRSGWVWGSEYLKGCAAMMEASIGDGKLYLFGPEITARAQTWRNLPLLFNAMLLPAKW
jgi:hypothetical protein